MAYAGFIWECSCGHIEYGEYAPEECAQCNKIDTFIKLPEEFIEEREKDISKNEFDDILAVRKHRLRNKTPKMQKQVKKTTRKKRK
ncbi:MAG: hypothetical protein AABX73_03195 [Nanoarchaeota archaeon]